MGYSLQWRHNEHKGVSNHRRHDCLLLTQRFVQAQIKKSWKLIIIGLYEGNSLVNSPHKAPVTRKIFPFDDVTIVKQTRVKNMPAYVPIP